MLALIVVLGIALPIVLLTLATRVEDALDRSTAAARTHEAR